MREGCCVCKGAFPEEDEPAKIAKYTYYVTELGVVVLAEAGKQVVPSHGREGGEERG